MTCNDRVVGVRRRKGGEEKGVIRETLYGVEGKERERRERRGRAEERARGNAREKEGRKTFDDGVIGYFIHGQIIIEAYLQKDTTPSDKIKNLCKRDKEIVYEVRVEGMLMGCGNVTRVSHRLMSCRE